MITAEQFNKAVKARNKKHEENLQIQVAAYMRKKYPEVIFHSDFSSGCKLSIGQAIRNKKMQSNHKYPDMFIAEPVPGYHGLYLELKKEGTKVFKEDGLLYANEHIKAQYDTILKLRDKGYKAEFAIGYEQAIAVIDDYMSLVI